MGQYLLCMQTCLRMCVCVCLFVCVKHNKCVVISVISISPEVQVCVCMCAKHRSGSGAKHTHTNTQRERERQKLGLRKKLENGVSSNRTANTFIKVTYTDIRVSPCSLDVPLFLQSASGRAHFEPHTAF